MTPEKLAILERFGDSDVQDLVAELRSARQRLAELELSSGDVMAMRWAAQVVTRTIEGHSWTQWGQDTADRALKVIDRLTQEPPK